MMEFFLSVLGVYTKQMQFLLVCDLMNEMNNKFKHMTYMYWLSTPQMVKVGKRKTAKSPYKTPKTVCTQTKFLSLSLLFPPDDLSVLYRQRYDFSIFIPFAIFAGAFFLSML